MKYKVFVTPKAAGDLRQIRTWYDKESDLLSERFFLSFDAALGQISKNPHRFMALQPDVRRALMRRFPYKIIFTVNEAMSYVYVIAVVHHARSPRVSRYGAKYGA